MSLLSKIFGGDDKDYSQTKKMLAGKPPECTEEHPKVTVTITVDGQSKSLDMANYWLVGRRAENPDEVVSSCGLHGCQLEVLLSSILDAFPKTFVSVTQEEMMQRLSQGNVQVVAKTGYDTVDDEQ